MTEGDVLTRDDRRSSESGSPELHRAEFEEFFRAHHRELAQLAFALTGNRADADEAAGEGLTRAWERWEQVRSADHPMAYVRKIVVNLAVDRVRVAIRERQRAALMAPIARPSKYDADVTAALDLHNAILTLPPGRRAVVVLRHIFDLPAEEVARTLGINVGTVKSQTAKGLAQLRLELMPDPAQTGVNPGLPIAEDSQNGRLGEGRHGE